MEFSFRGVPWKELTLITGQPMSCDNSSAAYCYVVSNPLLGFASVSQYDTQLAENHAANTTLFGDIPNYGNTPIAS
jgi:hypothetical protein